jgi:hypothetical protein
VSELTPSQIESWRRTRGKGRMRVVVEQFLAWSAVGLGGPTLRAMVKGGSGAASTYWTGTRAVVHLALGLALGVVMAFVFGVLSWNRMERLYGEATGEAPVSPATRPPA